MIGCIISFVKGLFTSKPVRLAIVRRYADANGSYVGELYMERVRNGMSSYEMIGVSLDSFPLEENRLDWGAGIWLDLRNDFLAPMAPNKVRVGAMSPQDNDSVRKMVGKLPRSRITLVIQNRFIERVLGQP